MKKLLLFLCFFSCLGISPRVYANEPIEELIDSARAGVLSGAAAFAAAGVGTNLFIKRLEKKDKFFPKLSEKKRKFLKWLFTLGVGSIVGVGTGLVSGLYYFKNGTRIMRRNRLRCTKNVGKVKKFLAKVKKSPLLGTEKITQEFLDKHFAPGRFDNNTSGGLAAKEFELIERDLLAVNNSEAKESLELRNNRFAEFLECIRGSRKTNVSDDVENKISLLEDLEESVILSDETFEDLDGVEDRRYDNVYDEKLDAKFSKYNSLFDWRFKKRFEISNDFYRARNHLNDVAELISRNGDNHDVSQEDFSYLKEVYEDVKQKYDKRLEGYKEFKAERERNRKLGE